MPERSCPRPAISRGDGPVTELARADRDVVPGLIHAGGTTFTVGQMLDATYTDGFAVLRDNRLVAERYWGAMTPRTPHLLQSVSKSLTSTLAGVLVGQGRLDPSPPVADYVSELRGGSFEGCTIAAPPRYARRHALLGGV